MTQPLTCLMNFLRVTMLLSRSVRSALPKSHTTMKYVQRFMRIAFVGSVRRGVQKRCTA